jgi:hypothetical protein
MHIRWLSIFLLYLLGLFYPLKADNIFIGFSLEENYEQKILPKRYLVGNIAISVPEIGEAGFELRYISFEPSDDIKSIVLRNAYYTTSDGSIKNSTLLKDRSFSFLIDKDTPDEIIITGEAAQEDKNIKYKIEGLGEYLYDSKHYRVKWTAIENFKLPDWQFCYGMCPGKTMKVQ